jgi:putative DNA primase/helicase
MPSNPVARVLGLLENVTEMTNGWTARCPAHGDNVNSLSIAEGTDGRVLIYCHAGCSLQEITCALGLRIRDLFAERRAR